MARLSEKHLGYRTKDQMLRDVTYVLNASLSYGTKLAVLRNVAWAWTEFHGKVKGCRYWSKLAFGVRHLDRKAKVRHEHVVPKSVVVRMLFDLNPAMEEQVRDICERFLIGVVVTLEEDAVLNVEYGKSMPSEFYDLDHSSYRDPWLRYRRYGIEVVCPDGRPGPEIRPLPTS